jgi:hypothetical protein
MALLLAALILAALVVAYWPVIVSVVAAIVAVTWAVRAGNRRAERVEAERRRLAGIAARADRQHKFVLAGDERGVFGEYPPDPRVGEFPAAATNHTSF